jgi:hypothetical protein
MTSPQLVDVPEDQLPASLFTRANTEPLRTYNPHELEALASRPQRILPLPTDIPESKRRKLAGLAQYRGRSPEGTKKSLGNLPRLVKMEQVPAPEPLEGVEPPAIPCAIAKVPPHKTIRGRFLRRIISREERDLYVETWNDWMTAYPEFDNVQDRDDVEQICMETVNMFRLKLLQMNKPTVDVDEPYNQAYRRKQEARSNLMARRKDREAAKRSNSNTTFNVAVIAGSITPEMMAERQKRLLKDEEKELSFLTKTVESVVIEQKALEKEEG